MSATPTPLHVRTIRVEAVEAGGDALLVTGTLIDERPRGGEKWFGVDGPRIIHQMRLGLRVRHPDLVITDVTGGMEAHPYRVCPEAVPPLQQLVGVSVARGFTRAVNERLGRERGCAHLTALIHAMAPVVKQAAGVAFQPVEANPADEEGLWVVNTCQAWRANGPLHRLVQAGDLEGLQDNSAYRPQRGDPARS
jgi:hypothetical protein